MLKSIKEWFKSIEERCTSFQWSIVVLSGVNIWLGLKGVSLAIMQIAGVRVLLLSDVIGFCLSLLIGLMSLCLFKNNKGFVFTRNKLEQCKYNSIKCCIMQFAVIIWYLAHIIWGISFSTLYYGVTTLFLIKATIDLVKVAKKEKVLKGWS